MEAPNPPRHTMSFLIYEIRKINNKKQKQKQPKIDPLTQTPRAPELQRDYSPSSHVTNPSQESLDQRQQIQPRDTYRDREPQSTKPYLIV